MGSEALYPVCKPFMFMYDSSFSGIKNVNIRFRHLTSIVTAASSTITLEDMTWYCRMH